MSKFEISSGVFFGKINKKMLVISIDNNRILIKKGLYRDYRLNFYIERRSKMKRVNWKRWLVVGLSCSLFMDSVVGVTVLAETITEATEQGVATSQSSDEASQTTQTTEESQATVASEAKNSAAAGNGKNCFSSDWLFFCGRARDSLFLCGGRRDVV